MSVSTHSNSQTKAPQLPEVYKRNLQKNEEFKIWKRAVPSFYQHISTFKPQFSKAPENLPQLTKSLVFSDRIEENIKDGLLEISGFYSLGNEIYEFKSMLPLGACYDGAEALAVDPNYGNSLKIFEDTRFEPTWISPEEKLVKLGHLGSENVIGITESGSLLWFKDGLRVPTQTSVPGSLLSDSSNVKKFVDFDISPDKSSILRFERHNYGSSDRQGQKSQCSLCLVDNKGRTGDVIRTISFEWEQHAVPDIHYDDDDDDGGCRFLQNQNLLASCTSDNKVRFWDTRSSSDSPICILNVGEGLDTATGRLQAFDTSKTIDTLFATGSDSGIVKVWDMRTVMGSFQSKTTESQRELLSFSHLEGNDGVTDIQFSKSSATDFITVGNSGSVYHWNMEYACRASMGTVRGYTDESCLVFYHTGGFRGHIEGASKRKTAVYHPVVDNLIGTIEDDGLITVYKPFTGENEVNSEDVNDENGN